MANRGPEQSDGPERYFDTDEKDIFEDPPRRVRLFKDKTPPDSPEKRNYIKVLESAILIGHNSLPHHRGMICVTEKTDQDETLWEGPVELFGLAGREKARNCYAWQQVDDEGKAKIVAVLEDDFIDSARRAVQAAIFTDVQSPLRKHGKGRELLKQQLQEAEKNLHEAQIRTEDLEAVIQSLREIKDRISRGRNTAS